MSVQNLLGQGERPVEAATNDLQLLHHLLVRESGVLKQEIIRVVGVDQGSI
jgi:hypothetical protein